MVDVNRLTTPANTRWKLVDRDTGAANHAIDWTFTRRRIRSSCGSSTRWTPTTRCTTRSTSTVPVGSSCSPATEHRRQNLVWKDTVLVRTGETVDILLDVTNLGRWMAHCHIAEHHESGMMLSFNVVPAEGQEARDA